MIMCHIARWCLSAEIDEGRPMPGIVRTHFRRCSACAEYARRVGAVELLVREGARLCGRSGAVGAERPVRRSTAGPAWAFAAAAVCLAVASAWLMLSQARESRTRSGPVQDAEVVRNPQTQTGSEPAVEAGPDELVAAVMQFVSGEELEREMLALIGNAHRMAENLIAVVDILPD